MRNAIALVVALLCACGEAPAPPPSDRAPAPPGEQALPQPIDAARPFDAEELARIYRLSPLPAPPPDPTNRVADDPDAAHLGQYLFFEPRLSGGGDVSCASCHDPGRGWADARALARGRAELPRHTLSLWNAAHARWFFWDGRADSLWSQALVPLEDPREHAGSRLQYAHLVHADAELREAYEALFGPLPDLADERRFPRAGRPVPLDPSHPHDVAWRSMSAGDRELVSRIFANLGKAIAAFVRQIVSADAPFDWYVASLRHGTPPPRVFSAAAERGLRLFIGEAGCSNCHHGPSFSDKEFHDTRVPPLRPSAERDLGRWGGIELLQASEFNGTGAFSDDPRGEAELKIDYLAPRGHQVGELKTPGLRNVAASAPYMHQGQMRTLEDVVRYYSTLAGALPATHPDPLLRPLRLSEQQVADLVAFLDSLTNASFPPERMVKPPSPRRTR